MAARDRSPFSDYGDSFGIVKPPIVKLEPHLSSQSQSGDADQQNAKEKDVVRTRAVYVIERWWRVIKDRRVFYMLKQAMCSSEYSFTQEILRKVTPTEAELLGDPAIQAKIKFRFGGEQFPPYILFKIFTSMSASLEKNRGSGGVKYISGRKMIKPASEAAADAKRQMGNRKFYDQILEDACQHQHFGVTDEVDITTMKDYMQYMANVDESPAYLGGKDNTWRRLDLTTLPRHTPLHNMLDLLNNSRGGAGVSLHQLESCTLPLTHQQQQIRTVPSLADINQIPSSQRSRVRSGSGHEAGGQRRSRQARRRAERMKKAYNREESQDCWEEAEGEGEGQGNGAEAWEEDVEDLYQWTQKLSYDDIR